MPISQSAAQIVEDSDVGEEGETKRVPVRFMEMREARCDIAVRPDKRRFPLILAATAETGRGDVTGDSYRYSVIDARMKVAARS